MLYQTGYVSWLILRYSTPCLLRILRNHTSIDLFIVSVTKQVRMSGCLKNDRKGGGRKEGVGTAHRRYLCVSIIWAGTTLALPSRSALTMATPLIRRSRQFINCNIKNQIVITRQHGGDLPKRLVNLVTILGRHQKRCHLIFSRESWMTVGPHGTHVLQVTFKKYILKMRDSYHLIYILLLPTSTVSGGVSSLKVFEAIRYQSSKFAKLSALVMS